MGFRSPSGNIHCMFMDAERGPDAFDAFVRCDIREIDGPLPSRPASCDAEWGRSFNITSQDNIGQIICVGDAVFEETHPVLSYGEVWQQSGFTCTSDQTGISCFNAKRHGFTLSRGSRQVF